MDNMNDDDRKLAAARLTLERAEAARLGRKLREERARLALLPAFAATNTFGALFPNDTQRRKVAHRPSVSLAIWGAKYFVLGWVVQVLLMTISLRSFDHIAYPIAMMVISTLVMAYTLSVEIESQISTRYEMAQDLGVLQQIFGCDPLQWVDDVNDGNDLARIIDSILSGELARARADQVQQQKSLTLLRMMELERRFKMSLPLTRALITR